jgi:hypothetical protein
VQLLESEGVSPFSTSDTLHLGGGFSLNTRTTYTTAVGVRVGVTIRQQGETQSA